MLNLTRTADYLSANLESMGFVIMSQRGGEGLPLVAARIDEDLGKQYDEFAVYVILSSDRLHTTMTNTLTIYTVPTNSANADGSSPPTPWRLTPKR